MPPPYLVVKNSNLQEVLKVHVFTGNLVSLEAGIVNYTNAEELGRLLISAGRQIQNLTNSS